MRKPSEILDAIIRNRYLYATTNDKILERELSAQYKELLKEFDKSIVNTVVKTVVNTVNMKIIKEVK